MRKYLYNASQNYKIKESQKMKKINFKIKGVTFNNRQNYIAYLLKHPKSFLVFSQEKDNKYDANAIAVGAYNPESKKYVPIGYVPKEIAKDISPLIDRGYKIYTHKYEVTGGYGYKFGVKVSISLYMPRENTNIAYATH